MIPLSSLPEVFSFVAQTLSRKGIILDHYFLFWDKVWATKPKTSGNEPKGIGNNDLDYVSQIFLPKMMGNDTLPCGFVYVIAPQIILKIITYLSLKLHNLLKNLPYFFALQK